MSNFFPDYYHFFFLGLIRLFIWIIILFGIVMILVKSSQKQKYPFPKKIDKERHLELDFSREDTISQLFLLLSFFFFGVTLISFNRNLNNPLTSQTILLINSIVGIGISYYFKAIFPLIFSLIGLVIWWGTQSFEWLVENNIKPVALLSGLVFIASLFYVLGYLHEKKIKFKKFASVYLLIGIITVTATLFFLSSKLGLMVLNIMTKGESVFSSWQISLSLFVLLILIVSIIFYSFDKKLILSFEAIIILLLILIFILLTLLPQQEMFIWPQNQQSTYFIYTKSRLSNRGIFWFSILNFLLFLKLLGLIFSGYRRKEKWFINIGTFFLFFLIINKYFDWFFTFLSKSIFFIGAGIIFFVIGWFMEKGRRHMLKKIQSETS